jgi:hypothetical protein
MKKTKNIYFDLAQNFLPQYWPNQNFFFKILILYFDISNKEILQISKSKPKKSQSCVPLSTNGLTCKRLSYASFKTVIVHSHSFHLNLRFTWPFVEAICLQLRS